MPRKIECQGGVPCLIDDGATFKLVKIPHRAPMPMCHIHAERFVADGRGRVTATDKVNRGGIVSDLTLPEQG